MPPKTKAAAKTKKELEGERTRALILEAAEHLFADHGYRATSVAQIAGACDISTATVFWHFHSKEAVLEAIFSEMLSEIRKIMAQPKPEPIGPEARLAVLSAADFDYFTQHVDRLRLLIGLVLEAGAAGGKSQELLRGLLRGYVLLLSGQLRQRDPELPQADAKKRAELFCATLAGLIVIRVADPEALDLKGMVDQALALILETPARAP